MFAFSQKIIYGGIEMYSNKLEFEYSEIIIYLRKSRSDDPNLSVEEVLARHEAKLQEWAMMQFGKEIPEENILREIVSGETIDDRPEMKRLLAMIESPKIKAILILYVKKSGFIG